MIAVIAAAPPTLAAILGFFANRRSLRRSLGASPGASLAAVIRSVDTKVERIEAKVDGLVEGQSEIRERLAHLEGETHHRLWNPSP
ncbi:MAG: hypothetical protein M3P01_00280 [Actinomycetota bacterium]|nr:hypothetical protein [Actinomycetota bacterium]